jgi:hypothetical protein
VGAVWFFHVAGERHAPPAGEGRFTGGRRVPLAKNTATHIAQLALTAAPADTP